MKLLGVFLITAGVCGLPAAMNMNTTVSVSIPLQEIGSDFTLPQEVHNQGLMFRQLCALTAAPNGMTIDATTGVINWTPTNAQVGANSVTIRVRDVALATVTQSYSITVANTNNGAPMITSTPVTAATPATPYSYDVAATDPDVGDTLTYSLVTAPSGMTINSSTGLLQWTPTTLGMNAVTVRVQDAYTAFDTQSFSIVVANLPELPRTYVDTTYVLPTGGTTYQVNVGDNLQAIIDLAEPGDVIQLQAGATFTGNFKLPKKTGDDWIYIVSSQLNRLPEGARVGPEDAVHMARIVSPNSDPALMTMFGAHHYRIAGIEISVEAANYNLILLGYGLQQYTDPLWTKASADTLDKLPHHITFDRVYLHSTSDVNRSRTGILADGRYIAVVDSHIANFKDTSDAQAICVWSGQGPYKIANNYLEATGENIMFGGEDPKIADLVPSDIEIRGNDFFKPLIWQQEDLWKVKNLFELKNAQRVLFSGNRLENNWVDGQAGTAVLFTVRNQSGGAPWSVVQDVTFENNIIRNAVNGFAITGEDDLQDSQQTKRILIRNNILQDISRGFFTISTPAYEGKRHPVLDLTINNNLLLFSGMGNEAVRLQSPFIQVQNFVFENNILAHGDYGLNISDERALDYSFGNNVIVLNPGERIYAWYLANFNSAYPNNFKADGMGNVGFIDYDQGNYRLSDLCPHKGAGTDGKDVGPDFDVLLAALGQ